LFSLNVLNFGVENINYSATFISPIFVTLMKAAPGTSEMSVLTRATRRNNTEDTILHSHRRENLKSYVEYINLKCVLLE
jgi:hypothetical protein